MGLLILIVPLLIYYIVIVPIVKIKIINDMQNKKLKTLAFIILLLFPIGDHIVGYVVYKVLCYTKGGVHIYKTVTDKQEQRNYWFLDNTNPNIGTPYHEENEKSYKYLLDNALEKRNGRCLKPIKVEGKNYYTCKKENIEHIYLNYCNPKYNTLPKSNPDYKRSCTNADEIIKKYHLKNVIKVPRSEYGYSTHWSRILPLWITFDIGQVKNRETQEILGKNVEITFWGGWYINLLSPFENRGIRCNHLSGSKLQESVIPNPYKNKNR